MYFIRNDGIEDLLFEKKNYVGESLSKIPYSKVKVYICNFFDKKTDASTIQGISWQSEQSNLVVILLRI